MSWEALEDLAAPPQLRGGTLRWKPSVGTELGGGGGGTGASPPRPSPPPACPTLRSQAPAAQSPWPTSWARGELSGETHRPEKLLENSGWLPGSVTRRLSRSELPRLPALELGLPAPRSPPTWAKLEMVPRTLEAGGDQPHVPPRPDGSGEPFPPPPLSAPRAPRPTAYNSPRRGPRAAGGVSMGPSPRGEASGAFIPAGGRAG